MRQLSRRQRRRKVRRRRRSGPGWRCQTKARWRWHRMLSTGGEPVRHSSGSKRSLPRATRARARAGARVGGAKRSLEKNQIGLLGPPHLEAKRHVVSLEVRELACRRCQLATDPRFDLGAVPVLRHRDRVALSLLILGRRLPAERLWRSQRRRRHRPRPLKPRTTGTVQLDSQFVCKSVIVAIFACSGLTQLRWRIGCC